MNIHYLKHTTTASLTALALCLGSIAHLSAQAPSYPIGQGPGQGPFGQPQAQQQTPAQSPGKARAPGQNRIPPGQARAWGQHQAWQQQAGGTGMVQVASAEADAFALQTLSGKPVRGASQEELGTVSDFLIDPQSGQVRYAVVPSGAGAAGETYRLIPIEALDPTSGTEGLRVSVSKAQWDQVGTMAEQRVKGSITLSDEQRQRLQQQFALAQQPGQAGSQLLRASALRGKMLNSGGQQLASIQDVAIDVRHQLAAAIVMPTGANPGALQKFLVPFAQLQISSPEETQIPTTLTQMHFQQALSGTPTGMTGSPFSSANPPAVAAAMAVRRAIDQDQTLPQSNVQVIPETRIALRGTVQSEAIRSNLERVAKEAAPGVQVDNHISVAP